MQLIVSSRFIKSGTDRSISRRKYLTKYIATREGVEIRDKKYATENQQKLLNELLNDFPESKKYLEYEDYQKEQTKENEIFRWLSLNTDIAKLYEMWCELERQKYKAYTQKEKEFPPIWENKVFQPVRNMIIREVDCMKRKYVDCLKPAA